MDKPKHEVSLPELVTNLVSMTEATKPEEENEKYVDALEQNEGTRPKILAVSPRDPKKDATSAAAGVQQSPDEWSAAPTPTDLPNMDHGTAPPSYASTNGHGMLIVYDREGLSEAQQMTLENLRRRRARNQRQRREQARQGSEDDKEQDELPDESLLQENREHDVAGCG